MSLGSAGEDTTPAIVPKVPPDVEIIMPSTVEAHRGTNILTAVQSVLDQKGVHPTVLFVANGPRQDPILLDKLSKMRGVRLISQIEGNLAKALRAGRNEVTAPWFGFLDDDDELLPGAISARLSPMLRDDRLSVVVTNGYRVIGGTRTPVYENVELFQSAPQRALAQTNWLASCGALYRTSDVGPDIWDGRTKYLEWTTVAFRLVQKRVGILFLEEKTFVINDSENSLSKSVDYVVALPVIMRNLINEFVPRGERGPFREKLVRLHERAAQALCAERRYTGAWQHHLSAMTSLYGFAKHWKFSVKLMYWTLARR